MIIPNLINPNIVTVNKFDPTKDELNPVFSHLSSSSVLTKIKDFVSKYNTIQTSFSGLKVTPDLAFRLDPITKKLPNDVLSASKFGGFPDLRNTFHSYAKEDLSDFLDRVWPRCRCCFKPMTFIAQIDASEWLAAINQITYVASPLSYDPNRFENIGLFGFEESRFQFRTNWMLFWACLDNPHFDEPHSDSILIFDGRRPFNPSAAFDEKFKTILKKTQPNSIEESIRLVHSSFRWTELEYIAEITKFYTKHGFFKPSQLHSPIEIEEIIELKLGFDTESDSDETPTKIDFLDSYESTSPMGYVLFGAPVSQQEPRRPFCQESYFGPHRKNPLLSWTDNEHDVSYQIYGCAICVRSNSEHSCHCKTDSSST